MCFNTLILFVSTLAAVAYVNANIEGDVLFAWKKTLHDPNNVLQSWDPKLGNHCTWFHVTCDSENNVTRLDLGNGALSGPLSPNLAKLGHLQYLELYTNRFTGAIPQEFGRFKRLRSLDLYENKLSGSIPASLGNLEYLAFLRVNNNKLTGQIPTEVLKLVRLGNLRILNVSKNHMDGTGVTITTIIQDPRA